MTENGKVSMAVSSRTGEDSSAMISSVDLGPLYMGEYKV